MKAWIKFFIAWLLLTYFISFIVYFSGLLWPKPLEEIIYAYILSHASNQEEVADIEVGIIQLICLLPCAVIAYFATVYPANKSKNANKENSEPPSAR
ncbi:hypothetical protein JMY81_23165 [Brenneria goodwinii]|uniref:hypothetical protein n=1 Tax=Brenneria goodwinii TaxID=1109412 RepID=UPI000EF1AA30|nr:hypothetical protein [Brenneria goodwinii]MCG8157523.1 hypothetical protein [Brenneria goodwinii]MCG8163688.1 hypothetical protein [Brenneria goodwinii]MCG8165337.1 hypothetical protein [Brenneria goodwinii]MCG8171034.1 hypothetical protein [Brenneria goodwinii]MCG8176000.1 hypothetical protein [Brenneria goodwinii]